MKKMKRARNIAAHAGIIVFFIMAFEFLIMISPFAFFFYSVFNPLLQWLDQYATTRWLTTFFLPHMVLPPTPLLKAIRILGSLFFILGALAFTVCALQVYLGKILQWGVADKGLYRYIRHPQYVGLGIWGIGLAILWPRFIVLVTLSLMFIIYYFLAKDEERRMLSQYGEVYEQYLMRTGMFIPRSIERQFHFIGRLLPNTTFRSFVISALIIISVIGSGLICREFTLHSLPLEAKNNITLISVLPEIKGLNERVLDDIFRGQGEENISFLQEEKDYLGYLMPVDHIMQGMIADTGREFHLFKRHNTFALIRDWVLHPFQHLRRPAAIHMAQLENVDPAIARRHHCPLGINDPDMECEHCPYRRVIFVELEPNRGNHVSKDKIFSFGTTRVPIGFIDINTITGKIINMRRVEKATAWKGVPTPAF